MRTILLIIKRLFFFSSRRRHTICALVTGVQTCALPLALPSALAEKPATRAEMRRLNVGGKDVAFRRWEALISASSNVPGTALRLAVDRYQWIMGGSASSAWRSILARICGVLKAAGQWRFAFGGRSGRRRVGARGRK